MVSFNNSGSRLGDTDGLPVDVNAYLAAIGNKQGSENLTGRLPLATNSTADSPAASQTLPQVDEQSQAEDMHVRVLRAKEKT
jgi:hypothetical protein